MGYVPGEGVQINRFAVAVGPIHGDRRRRMIFVNHLVDNEVPFTVVAAMAINRSRANRLRALRWRGGYVYRVCACLDGARVVVTCPNRSRYQN